MTVERLRIARMGHRGDGVADTAAGPVYVPYTLPGETVEADIVSGHPDRRHLLRVEAESPERIAPICPHFGICGGCAVQHWREDRYRDWKRSLVVRALADAGLDACVDPLVDAHGEGRRRAVLHARRGVHDVLQVGFAALRAHHIVPIDRCPVLAPALAPAIPAAWALAEALAREGKPLDIQATVTEGGLDVDVRGSGPLSPERMQSLARLAETHRLARLTRHGELVAQRAAPTLRIGLDHDDIGSIRSNVMNVIDSNNLERDCREKPVPTFSHPALTRVTLPPGAFLQATQAGEEMLACLVIAHVGKAQPALDLFAGIGPFALRLAQAARVTAVDSDAEAIAALAAAAKTPGLKPVQALTRDLFRRPFVPVELKPFATVVFDPPRQGAQAQAKELAASGVPLIVAVSCNPGTFARDAKLLADGGYRPTRITPVDQFRYSAHVEIVAAFERA